MTVGAGHPAPSTWVQVVLPASLIGPVGAVGGVIQGRQCFTLGLGDRQLGVAQRVRRRSDIDADCGGAGHGVVVSHCQRHREGACGLEYMIDADSRPS